MHYYQFNIGDYASHTAHLEPLEDLAYRRMLDLYYLSQAPLPSDVQRIAKLIRMPDHAAIIREILNEFFKPTDDGWANTRADGEIQAYTRMANGGAKGAAKRWHKAGDSHPIATPCPPHTPPYDNPNSKQETINNNHKPINNTLAKAKAASGDLSTKDEIWKAGKSLLSEQGMPEKQCGSFVGKLVKDYGADTVVDAVRVAVLERPADAASYLKAVCQRNSGERKPMQSFRERDAQLASDRVAMVAPSIAANKTAPYVDAADFIEAMAKPKPLEIAHD